MQLYHEAHELAASTNSSDQLFGKPLALPVVPPHLIAPPTNQPGSESTEDDAVIRLMLAVDQRGRVDDVQVLETSPDTSPVEINRARRILQSTRFRPRFASGEPVTTTGLSYNYRYTP